MARKAPMVNWIRIRFAKIHLNFLLAKYRIRRRIASSMLASTFRDYRAFIVPNWRFLSFFAIAFFGIAFGLLLLQESGTFDPPENRTEYGTAVEVWVSDPQATATVDSIIDIANNVYLGLLVHPPKPDENVRWALVATKSLYGTDEFPKHSSDDDARAAFPTDLSAPGSHPGADYQERVSSFTSSVKEPSSATALLISGDMTSLSREPLVKLDPSSGAGRPTRYTTDLLEDDISDWSEAGSVFSPPGIRGGGAFNDGSPIAIDVSLAEGNPVAVVESPLDSPTAVGMTNESRQEYPVALPGTTAQYFFPPQELEITERLRGRAGLLSDSQVSSSPLSFQVQGDDLSWQAKDELEPLVTARSNRAIDQASSFDFYAGLAIATGTAALIATLQERLKAPITRPTATKSGMDSARSAPQLPSPANSTPEEQWKPDPRGYL